MGLCCMNKVMLLLVLPFFTSLVKTGYLISFEVHWFIHASALDTPHNYKQYIIDYATLCDPQEYSDQASFVWNSGIEF